MNVDKRNECGRNIWVREDLYMRMKKMNMNEEDECD